jgi:hypothetical protein
MPKKRTPLTADEREGIILAVNSAFRKLKNLYTKIVPIFEDFGFTPPSAGVIARDLSEKIEKAIIQHCESFRKGNGHCDLCRFDQDSLHVENAYDGEPEDVPNEYELGRWVTTL